MWALRMAQQHQSAGPGGFAGSLPLGTAEMSREGLPFYPVSQELATSVAGQHPFIEQGGSTLPTPHLQPPWTSHQLTTNPCKAVNK